MGKPLFKAQDGGRFEVLWERDGFTQNELQWGKTSVLLDEKVRPATFPSGLPMSVWTYFYAIVGVKGAE